MYKYNSTIKIKEKVCIQCGLPRPIFSKGRCIDCSRMQTGLNKAEKKIIEDPGLPILIEILDGVFSKYIRLKYADESGYVACYITGKKYFWRDIDNGHFVSRGNMLLRFDERNCRPCSIEENRWKDGNIPGFAQKLEEEVPGIVEILLEEGRIIYKYDRQELNSMIFDYRNKVSILLKSKHIDNG